VDAHLAGQAREVAEIQARIEANDPPEGLRARLLATSVEPLTIRHRYPRRVAEPKRTTPPHVRRRDLSKLVRAAEDALIGVLFTDDSQVTRITSEKRTCAMGEQPGVHITRSRP
jgi:hypothetical protein